VGVFIAHSVRGYLSETDIIHCANSLCQAQSRRDISSLKGATRKRLQLFTLLGGRSEFFSSNSDLPVFHGVKVRPASGAIVGAIYWPPMTEHDAK
jgi:hypothetical protein